MYVADKYASIDHLKACLAREVLFPDKKFSWAKTIHRAIKCPDRRFNFWFRIANYLYLNNKMVKTAKAINFRLCSKYGVDIMLGIKLGEGFSIAHFVGIVITNSCVIGKNFSVRQGVTIGVHHTGQTGMIYIGDNVSIGVNSCIIGDDIRIGDYVTVGAIAFVNRSIPAHSTVFNKRPLTVISEAVNDVGIIPSSVTGAA